MRCACSPSAPAWLSRRASTWSASSSPGWSLACSISCDDVAQVVGPAAHLVAPARERGLLLAERRERRVRLGHGRPLRLRVRERVEDVALRVGVQQRLGLVLAVEVHQERAELAEHRRPWSGCR